MMRNQWNTLRVGDDVFVHSDEGELVSGTVVFVSPGDATGDANSVGVRVAGDEETYYAWPSLADVHTDVAETSESCVHCRLLQAQQPSAGATTGTTA